VTRFGTVGITSGRGSGRDQSGGALVPRAILVQRHARDRRKGWRFINPAAGIALTRACQHHTRRRRHADCCRAKGDRDDFHRPSRCCRKLSTP
jgi:hypothetical protein